tara:strand:+ start:210 stop:425 length:216 start_codon:yes stop_codon:yes gene_type:complete
MDNELRDQLTAELWDQLSEELWNQLSNPLSEELRGQLGLSSQLGWQLQEELVAELRRSITHATLKENMSDA